MSLHFTDNKSNSGTSVARTPFLIEDILYQHSNSLKLNGNVNTKCATNNALANSNGANGTINNNNNNKVNGNIGDNSIIGGKTNRTNSEILSAMHPTEEEYRKLLQNDR